MTLSIHGLVLGTAVIVLAFFNSRACGLPQTQPGPLNHSKVDSSSVIVSSQLGSVHVINSCPFSVQSNIVHSPRAGVEGPPEEILSTLQPGHRAAHPFAHDPDMGISWKIVRDDAGPVQFEWTWAPRQQRTYWDLSMIDAHASETTELVKKRCEEGGAESARETDHGHGADPTAGGSGVKHGFAEYGMSVQIMVGDRSANKAEIGGTCLPIACPKGNPICSTAYNAWDDWEQQHDCPEHVSLHLTLCG